MLNRSFNFFFFFNDTATTEIYTLSLHDALPIFSPRSVQCGEPRGVSPRSVQCGEPRGDRKSTRLNSSHSQISYAVFCLKKKKRTTSIMILYVNCNDVSIYSHALRDHIVRTYHAY